MCGDFAGPRTLPLSQGIVEQPCPTFLSSSQRQQLDMLVRSTRTDLTSHQSMQSALAETTDTAATAPARQRHLSCQDVQRFYGHANPAASHNCNPVVTLITDQAVIDRTRPLDPVPFCVARHASTAIASKRLQDGQLTVIVMVDLRYWAVSRSTRSTNFAVWPKPGAGGEGGRCQGLCTGTFRHANRF